MSLRERPAFLRASVIAGTGPAKIIFRYYIKLMNNTFNKTV